MFRVKKVFGKIVLEIKTLETESHDAFKQIQ